MLFDITGTVYGTIMWKIIALFLLVSLAAAEKASYENYKVFRIIPATVDQVETLRALEEIPDGVSKDFAIININVVTKTNVCTNIFAVPPENKLKSQTNLPVDYWLKIARSRFQFVSD